ncbi:ATP-binding protein [Candidatus Avelusimicrobium stercoris]|uniref:ATP-binding protein n=1 Tax=Candidatus Avelusimicrobium stercoris TaxID=1947924 RepID=UPI003D0A22D0
MKYIHRTLEKALLAAVKQFPALVLTGPRQTGKSTLLKQLFPAYNYITLDDFSVRNIAKQDPALFVSTLQTPVILDEIQYAPELLNYIKIHIDKERVNGRFLLTGSQMFNVMQGMSETLAGRVALFELLPLSFQELDSIPKEPLACFQQIMRGFYPMPNIQEMDLPLFYGSYLSTYVERDVRQIKNIQDIASFQRFLELLAIRIGNLLNMQELASECGVSNPTVKNWLSILESSRIIYLLKPYFKNVGKRLIKTPKVYFTDTGLVAHLLRYKDADTLLKGPVAGAIFENMVIMEAIKENMYNRTGYEFYFYRDTNQVEADLVVDKGQTMDLYEIKATQTLQAEFAKKLQNISLPADSKTILSLSSATLPLKPTVMAKPWWSLAVKDK